MLYSLLLNLAKNPGDSETKRGHNNDALALWTTLGGIATAGLFWGLSALGELAYLTPAATLLLLSVAGFGASAASVMALEEFSTPPKQ